MSPARREGTYCVDLEPFDPATASRLRYYNGTTWADTSVGHSGGARWMFEWTEGVSLLTGKRDVQLPATAIPLSGSATYTVAVLRGTSLADLRSKASAVISRLSSTPN